MLDVDLTMLRAAWWAMRALRRVRRDLARDGVNAQVRPPPSLPDMAGRGVLAVVKRSSATCLEESLVLQCWLAAHGQPHDVVIGVAPGGGGIDAHAWVEGTQDTGLEAYVELHRLPPP
jgi:Transglutaminase-like superfamily